MKSSPSPATDGEGTPLEQINPGEAVDLCGRLEAGHRIASATAYHRAAAWERLARALAKRFDAIGTEQESIWRLRAEEVGALGSQSLVSETRRIVSGLACKKENCDFPLCRCEPVSALSAIARSDIYPAMAKPIVHGQREQEDYRRALEAIIADPEADAVAIAHAAITPYTPWVAVDE